MESVTRNKAQLRTTCLRQLKEQEEKERRQRSRVIWRKVFRLAAFRQARVIFCYVALPYEVQTWQMIESMLAKGKRVVVPVAQPRTKRLTLSEVRDPAQELAPGAHGVFEPRRGRLRPVSKRDLDLVLVPGVAFDRKGFRLGHGQGYFDRFLAGLPKDTPTVGLAFRFQVFKNLPTAAHDHAVSKVLTA